MAVDKISDLKISAYSPIGELDLGDVVFVQRPESRSLLLLFQSGRRQPSQIHHDTPRATERRYPPCGIVSIRGPEVPSVLRTFKELKWLLSAGKPSPALRAPALLYLHGARISASFRLRVQAANSEAGPPPHP